MAQSGYTPILIYASSTPGALPSAANLTSSASGVELAINYADGKLYFKNSSGVVTLLAGSSSGPAGGSNTQVQYNSSGVLAGSSNLTFDGTSLTLGGNPTLSAGAANGVLYLNGSKVATSGSALTFDGTTLSLNGGSNGTRLAVKGTGAFGGFDTGAATDGRIEYAYNGTNTFYTGIDSASLFTLMARSGVSLAFGANGSEAMRLTSTSLYTASGINVGIGTSSPYSGTRLTLQESASNPGGLAIRNRNSTQTWQISVDAAAVDDRILAFIDPGAGAVRMALDSSSNLGLGVTPSAWGSGYTAFQLTTYGTVYDYNAGYTGHASNAYYNGTNWIYRTTNFATRYEQYAGGTHAWFTAPSGTAGNAITFTQAFTLDANRNLLLNGTTAGTSSVGTFAIFNGTAPTGSVTNGCILYAEDVSSSSELKVRDEAGNVTTLSPHNFSLIPEGPSEDMAWSYYSERDGRRINIDMLKAIRLLEKLSGEQLVYES
jgi:hypothetical protein